MHRSRRHWLVINIVGGVAVLGSYVHGLLTHPETRLELWGSTPAALQGIYNFTMLAAAAGYFLFSYFFFFRVDPATDRIGKRPAFSVINALYAAVLVASALWMPLTFAYLEAPSAALWIVIRTVLLITGAGSVGLLFALVALRRTGLAVTLAVVGLLAFCLQTAFLDAFVWPAFMLAR